jgi:hypothetical protein
MMQNQHTGTRGSSEGLSRARRRAGTAARRARRSTGRLIQTLESRVLMTTTTTPLTSLADSAVRDALYATRTSAPRRRSHPEVGSGFNRQGYVKFDLTQGAGERRQGGPAAVRAVHDDRHRRDAGERPKASPTSPGASRRSRGNNRPAAGAAVGTALFGTSYKWVDVDVTPYVAVAKAGGAAAVSFALAGAQTGAAQVLVNAKESGGNRPTLVGPPTARRPRP